MKYTPELVKKITQDYQNGISPEVIAATLTLSQNELVPERSVIAKLSSLGVYRKKTYLTKRGLTPVKKSEYIEQLALLLEVNSELLESLEKVNKNVLALFVAALTPKE